MSDAQSRAEKLISSWSVLYGARKEFLKRYRTVWDVPVRDSHKDVLAEELFDGARVLEIGSSDRSLVPFLKARFPSLVYKSMDVDRETKHDYYRLDDVAEKFDAALLVEVIEHVPFAEGVRLLARVYDLLVPGGKLIVVTPNLAHPTHFYRDPTHVTPYSHEGLGGVLVGLGFEVARAWRIFDAPVIEKGLRMYVTAPLTKYLGIDFAHSLVFVAARPKA